MGGRDSGVIQGKGKRARILIAEDDRDEALLLERTLERGKGSHFEIRFVETVTEAVALIDERWPDVLILDLTLRDSQGAATVERARAADPSLPIVVLTGFPEIELSDALGVQDYLIKGETSPQILLRALRYAIQSMEWTTALRQSRADLRTFQSLLGVTAFRLTRGRRVQAIGEVSVAALREIEQEKIIEALSSYFDRLDVGHRTVRRISGRTAYVLRANSDELFVALKRRTARRVERIGRLTRNR